MITISFIWDKYFKLPKTMKSASYQIKTHKSSDEVYSILNNATDKKAKLPSLISPKKFFGQVNEKSFRVESYHSHSLRITGTVSENEDGSLINIKVICSDIAGAELGLLKGLSYPFYVIIIIILLIVSSHTILIIVLGTIGLFVLMGVIKLYQKFEGSENSEPEEGAEILVKLLEGTLVD